MYRIFIEAHAAVADSEDEDEQDEHAEVRVVQRRKLVSVPPVLKIVQRRLPIENVKDKGLEPVSHQVLCAV